MYKKMIGKKISVVIPVYNAERYLSRCLRSIQGQDYKNWEVLAVDDGSEDNSLNILMNFSEKDSRIRVMHQENQGAGAARNRGIAEVSGDYLVFVDADDYIEPDYFGLLKEHSEDIVFIDVNRRDNTGKIKKVERTSIYEKCSKDDIMRSQMTGKVLWGGVRKAVCLQIVQDNNIRYTKHKVGEEAIYSFEVLYYSKSIGFIKKAVYNYEVHAGSLSQTIMEDPWSDVSSALRTKIEDLGEEKRFSNTLNAFIVTAAIVSLDKMAQKYSYNEYKKLALKKYLWARTNVYHGQEIDRFHMDSKAKLLLPFFIRKQFGLIYFVSRLRH